MGRLRKTQGRGNGDIDGGRISFEALEERILLSHSFYYDFSWVEEQYGIKITTTAATTITPLPTDPLLEKSDYVPDDITPYGPLPAGFEPWDGYDDPGGAYGSTETVLLSGVPAYVWHHGCAPTSAGMVMGYWDAHGYPNYVVGDASSQTFDADQMIASDDLVTGTPDHWEDYSLPMDSGSWWPIPDRSQLGGAHASDSVADFMHTSWSLEGLTYGGSWPTMVPEGMDDYAASVGYAQATSEIEWWDPYSAEGFWTNFKIEIASGRPMVFGVDVNGDSYADHAITAIGYDDATHRYACYNTWDTDIHWYDFTPTAVGQLFGVDAGIYFYPESAPTPGVPTSTDPSMDLINMDDLHDDPRFAGIDGSGFSVAVIDTGINPVHDFFSGRIVSQFDFGDWDTDATDYDGHGTNVAGIVAADDTANNVDPHLPSYDGVAPGADIIALKVFPDFVGGAYDWSIEQALQWCVANQAAFDIAAVNMSLGALSNYDTVDDPNWPDYRLDGFSDEIAALAAMDVMVVIAAGNDFAYFEEVGVSSPAVDPNALAIGAVWAGDYGPWGGNVTTDADMNTYFSQRHPVLMEAFAPGGIIVSAGVSGTSTLSDPMSGTSQAAPHVAGMAVLAQQLAVQELGRRLTLDEFRTLLANTGATVYDGAAVDDPVENDIVRNTDLYYKRADMFALADAIWELGNPGALSQTPFSPDLAVGSDTGKYDADEIVSYVVLQEGTRHTYQTAPGTRILDNRTILSTLQVPDHVTIADIDVSINIEHTWDSDLDVFLVAPNGTRVVLFTDVGDGGDDFAGTNLDDEAATAITAGAATFLGRFRPEGNLADFDGLDAFGTWTLQVRDDAAADEGILLGWGLSIAEQGAGSATAQFTVNNTVVGASVELFADADFINPIGTAPAGSATTTVDVDLSTLADGVHYVTARQTEGGLAGSFLTPALMIVVDTQRPTVPSAPDLVAATDGGLFDWDKVTDSPRHDFAVDGTPFFRVYHDGAQVSGSYERTSPYTYWEGVEGTHVFVADAADYAGNSAGMSAITTVGYIDISHVGYHAYVDTVVVGFVDVDLTNGLSIPIVAWSPREYQRGVTDILVNPGGGADMAISSIKFFGDGTRTRDIAVVVTNNRFVSTIQDLRTNPTPISMIYSEGGIRRIDWAGDILGFDFNGRSIVNSNDAPDDIDGDLVTNDAVAVYGGLFINNAYFNGGDVNADVASLGQIRNLSVKASGGRGGTLSGEVRTPASVNNLWADTIAATAHISAGEKINIVRGNVIGGAGHTITSAGIINRVESANGNITSTITANGANRNAVGTVEAKNGDVNGAVNAPNGGVNRVKASYNKTTGIGGNVNAAVSGSAVVTMVEAIGQAGNAATGNVTGAITVTNGDVKGVKAQNGDIANTAIISAVNGTVSNVQADAIGTGGAGHAIIAQVVKTVKSSNGGINSTITATGTGNNAVNTVEARNGDVDGAVNAPNGGVNTVKASYNKATGTGGNINAAVSGSTRVSTVQAVGGKGNAATGNIRGAITSANGSVNTVKAQNGNVENTATINAGGTVNNVQGDAIGTGGAGHTITAGVKVNTVKSDNGGINSTITANGAANSAVNTVEARNGDVDGAVNAPNGGVNTVKASYNRATGTGGNVNAAVSGSTRVSTVQAVGGKGNAATGNIRGAITSANGSVNTVKAQNGNVENTATINAGGTVNNVQGDAIGTGGAGHTITAGVKVNTVKSDNGGINSTITANGAANDAVNKVEAKNGDVDGAVNAPNGGVNTVKASYNKATLTGGNVNAAVTAQLRVNKVQAAGEEGNVATGNITGDVTSNTAAVNDVTATNGSVTGNVSGATIGKVRAVNGSINGSRIDSAGTVSLIQSIGGDVINVIARIGGQLSALKSGRDILNTMVSAAGTSSLRAARNVSDCLFAAGYDFGGDNTVGTADDTLVTGTNGNFVIGGNYHDTTTVAGVGPGVDAIFGTADDAGAGGTGRQGTVTVGGTITTSGPGFAIEADSGTFTVRDSANSVAATAAAQAFPGTTLNVQVI